MLKQRLITAAILIPIFLLILLFTNPIVFGILTTFMVLYAALEWSALVGIEKRVFRLVYAIGFFPFLPLSLIIPLYYLLIVTLVYWLIVLVLVVLYPRANELWSRGYFWRGLMGVMTLVPCWRALNFLRTVTPDGPYILLLLFVLIWGADSGAYFGGKKWGKNKLAPQVSPGKTWEGFLGAVFTTVLIALGVAAYQRYTGEQALIFILFALVTVVFSVLGDLFESMLKRQVNIKDSGGLFPGHGGLLDRIDSLTAAAPIFALGGLYISNYFL